MPTVKKSLLSIPVTVLTVLLLSAAVSAASAKSGIVTGEVVNVRSTPDITAKILVQLEKGNQVSVLGSEGDWFKVSFNDTTGWINDSYLVIRDQATSSGIVSGDVVNVRAKADISSDVLAKLEKGTKVDIFEHSGDWYRISIGDDRYGWVNREYLSVRSETVSRGLTTDVTAPVTMTEDEDKAADENSSAADPDVSDNKDAAADDNSSVSEIRQEIVAYAKKFLGVRYRYGGSTPNGFDCSGFVSYVFDHFGITLERASRDMGANGTAVKKDDLQPGDLVFFDTNGGLNSITHVGIYIGGGKFIHASTSNAHRVTISSLSESYYAHRFMRARDYLS